MSYVVVAAVALLAGGCLGALLALVIAGGRQEDRARRHGRQDAHQDGVTDLARTVGVLVDEPAPREAL